MFLFRLLLSSIPLSKGPFFSRLPCIVFSVPGLRFHRGALVSDSSGNAYAD